MNLSILITAHAEPWQEVQDTIRSIRETAGDKVEIVVVDDATQVPLSLEDKNAVLIRNNHRAGVGPSRHVAATHSKGDWLLITDAHMRFEKGWLEKVEKRVDKSDASTVLCTSCVALSPNQMDMARATHTYSGARLSIFGPEKGNMDVLEGKWLPETKGDDFPMSCLMGACYLVNTDWFFHIGGLRMLRGWGHDEPLLAIKTWLAGGEVRMMKSVRIGHQFRTASSYRTENWKMIWNRLAIAYTCMPEKKADKIMSLLTGSSELIEAKQHFFDDAGLIFSERAYLQSIFVRDFDWLCSYFQLDFPK